ncbi:glycosyltransferase family 2 protein [Thetidibacter halocola]|uniref:Glycosyltransferase family 2 protein n=1 Tax=Thetidibacter halocola TaxID=2827239 RepID=A0A8J8B9I0_9RHOB|nr:glycosyltransferase family 2 protein [Thetidibacter halocola]MBS0125884.1 glycosyltransferase family 2 protein [Thetidibacter halocola]
MPGGGRLSDLWAAYRARMARRALLWRSFRSRHRLAPVSVHEKAIRAAPILCFAVVRIEAARLPWWLDHHRALGVGHFLVVDNGSTDGTRDVLDAPDISVWRTDAVYREARFGLDWASWLLMRHGHGKWCLTLDADELLVYPHHDRAGLSALTAELDRRGQPALGALMLDLYPRGPLGAGDYRPGTDPVQTIPWFDTAYRARRVGPRRKLWVQGGVRDRAFFAETPERAPTLNKLPLVRWNRRFAYDNSTHTALPPRLNMAYPGPPGLLDEPDALSGVLLHTKFLPEIVGKSAIEKSRGQHFHDPTLFHGYYDAITGAPDLWHPGAQRYCDWRQLVDLGLMSAAGWQPPEG